MDVNEAREEESHIYRDVSRLLWRGICNSIDVSTNAPSAISETSSRHV
jgi:hypothetical protein